MIEYKFKEGDYLKELQDYIDSTYNQHYADGKYQATDLIMDAGHGTGFCIGNVMKYAKRYGKKGTPEDYRKDLMKVLHYALLQLYNHDEIHSGVNDEDCAPVKLHDAELDRVRARYRVLAELDDLRRRGEQQ